MNIEDYKQLLLLIEHTISKYNHYKNIYGHTKDAERKSKQLDILIKLLAEYKQSI